MDWTEWVLGMVALAVVTSIIWVGKILYGLPAEYMPRQQIDQRFRELEQRLHSDMTAAEGRADKQFDAVNAKLDKIIDKLDSKADK
jgi:hypothetical protein